MNIFYKSPSYILNSNDVAGVSNGSPYQKMFKGLLSGPESKKKATVNPGSSLMAIEDFLYQRKLKENRTKVM